MPAHHSDPRGDSEGLWDWNLASNRVHYSSRWVALVGCDEREVGNTPDEWLQRVHPEDAAEVARTIEAARANTPSEFDCPHRLRHKDGTYRWMSCRGVATANEHGEIGRLAGAHADVTAATVTDTLTGLPNRLLLVDRLTRSIEHARQYPGLYFAVLLLDLGRPAGSVGQAGQGKDPLLTRAARRLETSLRIGETPPIFRHNDLVARVHGDLFAILLDGLKDAGHATVVAERIIGEMLAPFSHDGHEVFCSTSIGIALSATGYSRADDVLRDAETALHRARVLGGSRCEVFDTAVLKAARAELALESDLKGALERRELHLLFQPIVSLASHQIVGFEALVRWQHPVLGLIPPTDFIPLAERTGSIVALGEWVLREACLQLRAWKDSLPVAADLSMSVNLASPQLSDPALIGQIRDALRDAALSPSSLVLELTEGMAMANPGAIKTALMQLRALGVRISLDDFGTGYSSLAYLRQFPLDALKIDRSFVRGIEIHTDMVDIVRTISTMAQQLGLRVVAEGIENEAQLALLRSLHCDCGQGYLFGKPLDRAAAAQLLTTGPPERQRPVPAEEPAPPGADEAHLHTLADAGRPNPTVGWRSAAGVAALLTAAAVGAWVVYGRGPVRLTPLSPAVEHRASLPLATAPDVIPAGSAKDISLARPSSVRDAPAIGSATSGAPSAVAATGLGLQKSQAVEPVQFSGAVASPAAASSAPTRTSAAADAARARPAVPRSASLEVVHLHRMGSCEGRLVVSRTGVAFVPGETGSEDAVTLAYADFTDAVEDGRLTIKAKTRTYRFKAAQVTNGADHSSLQAVVETIARNR
jgi:diguanylate cyclase (GGDEF)-like protein